MTKNKTMRLVGIILLTLLGFATIALLILNQISTNTLTVDISKSLITAQKEIEESFSAEGYSIDNPKVIVNPYGNSPLTALVIFESDEELAVKITVQGKDELTTFTNLFESSRTHFLPIYGLYAGVENEIVIEAGDKIKKVSIKTAELPENFVVATKIEAQKAKLTNDLYFFTPSGKEGDTVAYDVNGDVRWYLTQQAIWKMDRVKNGRLLLSTERPINAPYYTTGLYEMDLLGKIYAEYSLPGGYHHDYYEMENGNLLVASDDFDSHAGTVEDIIVEIDRNTGEIVKNFDLKGILKMGDGQSENWTSHDWFHNNSVWYDKKTNSITLSGRHQDAVININYDDGRLNWIIGDPTNWSEDYQKYFFEPIGELEWQWSQHAAMITPEGYVFILDNGNNKSKLKEEYVPATESYTRGVIYKIDQSAMTIEQIWQYGKERGSEFYSPYISDVDYLNHGHYIVHSGGIVYKDGVVQNAPAGLASADKLVSDTVEILNDEVIFEIILPTNNYRVEKMQVYTGKEDLKLGERTKRAGTLGETNATEKKFGSIISSKKLDDNYKKHNIRITKEEDRLIVEGQFKRENTVNVVLYKNLHLNIYNIKVSKKPYTALCVDIFTEEEDENGIVVSKYINSEGLDGKYSIYIELDGVLYNTERVVKF